MYRLQLHILFGLLVVLAASTGAFAQGASGVLPEPFKLGTFEVEYASSIITLYPGDVIKAGTSGGVGMGRAVRGKQMFMKSGDQIVASIEGIGTLTLPVVAEEPPRPGTGSFLPPVSSYRK